MNTIPLSRPLALCCLAMSMSLVGSYVALSKPLTLVFPVLLLAWLRFGIGGLAILHWLKKPASELPMTRQIRQLIFLESFLGNFLFSICMLFGVSMTSAVSAGVIMAAIPAVVALLSWIFLRERISLRVWAGVACAMLAVSLLALSRAPVALATGDADAVAGQREWIGNLLIFAAVICEAAYAVIGKKLTGALSPRRITALINGWGFALMTPMGIVAALQFDFSAVHVDSWLLLVFYSLAASVGTVWLWMTGLRVIPASQGGVFTVMLPITATIVGVTVLGEPFSQVQLAAFLIALLGVVLATWPGRKSPAV